MPAASRAARAVVLIIAIAVAVGAILITTAQETPDVPVAGGASVLVGAGDIAECGDDKDEATAALLDAIPGTVFTAGDNAYPMGRFEDFENCYEPSWGRHKDRTRPAPGNHDFGEEAGAAYYGYFGRSAGEPGKGYYSYVLGGWRVIVLNSECHRVGCEAGSEQEEWLREELARSAEPCTVAILHEPRFSSGRYGNNADYGPFWEALYASGAEIVISGHEHFYERFRPQNPQGEPDDEQGIRQFIVGTGGGNLRGFVDVQPNSEVRASVWGVLKQPLDTDRYDWEFVPIAGETFTDLGSGTCH
jgi:acid phosphatase type 7